jgi:hypothetical protein
MHGQHWEMMWPRDTSKRRHLIEPFARRESLRVLTRSALEGDGAGEARKKREVFQRRAEIRTLTAFPLDWRSPRDCDSTRVLAMLTFARSRWFSVVDSRLTPRKCIAISMKKVPYEQYATTEYSSLRPDSSGSHHLVS